MKQECVRVKGKIDNKPFAVVPVDPVDLSVMKPGDTYTIAIHGITVKCKLERYLISITGMEEMHYVQFKTRQAA